MSPHHSLRRLTLAGLAAGLLALSAAAEISAPATLFPSAPPPLNRLMRGQTAEQVRKLLGRPNRVSRQILSDRHREQWGYDRPQPVRLEFECLRGQKARLLRGRLLHPDKP